MKKSLRNIIFAFAGCFALLVAVFALSLTQATPKKNTVCLNMIVKNEKDVIRKCLASTKGLIDHWVIVDTGSTDGTQAIIKEYMKDIPGTLYERPWVNFGHNREEAYQLAKNTAEYTMFIDADEVLDFSPDFARPVFDKDMYQITVKRGNRDGGRTFLVRNALDWHWKGVLHESIECNLVKTAQVLPGVFNRTEEGGARAKNPRKHLDDAIVLEKGLKAEPNNTRYQFYLAQCYANAGEFPLALQAYKKRVAMGEGFPGEYFCSLYTIGRMQEVLAMPLEIVVESYMKASACRPWRLEPLFYAAGCYAKAGEIEKAYEMCKKGASLTPNLEDNFFVELDVVWQLQHLLADVCWRLGKVQESLEACEKLVLCKDTPEELKKTIRADIVKIKEAVVRGVLR